MAADGMEFQLLKQIDVGAMDSFFFYAALLALKMLCGISLITYNRIKHNIASNPEDRSLGMQHGRDHPDIERSQRMLANDMENIVPFFFLGLFLCMTSGGLFSVDQAKNIFRAFFVGRVCTSICHYFCLQPFRSISWIVAFIANLVLFYTIISTINPISAMKYL